MGAVAGGDEGVLALNREDTQIRPTIFRATDKIREEYPYGFTPEIVSIGPYHRNRPSLQYMEDTKLRRLLSLITRNHQSNTLDRYLVAVPVEGAQRQYKHLHVGHSEFVEIRVAVPVEGTQHQYRDLHVRRNEFLKTMVIDAGFIIEFFIKLSKGELEQNQRMTANILHDLLLLENQIPFHVLQSVFDSSAIFVDEPVPVTLLDLVLRGIKSSRLDERKYLPASEGIHHLLHIKYLTLSPDTRADLVVESSPSHFASLRSFIGKCFWRRLVNLSGLKVNKRDNPSIPSATELRKCGIVFEVDTNAHMLDIKFNPNRGILTLPFFVMSDRMASEFLNLMMFEQGCPSVGNYFTSFITFMAGLIAGPEDARYIKKIGMIDNMLGGDDALARFFNDLGKHAHVDSASHYLSPLCNSLISYCSLDHHRCRAALFSEYCSTPLFTKYFWSVIHFCVVISLLVSILQSHNSIFNYWFPRS